VNYETKPTSIPALSYPDSMTGLLERALKRIESLPEKEQDTIASQILEMIEDEDSCERSFQENRETFRALAEEAIEEHRRGETRPIEDLLGE
jgi:hypothetical protein